MKKDIDEMEGNGGKRATNDLYSRDDIISELYFVRTTVRKSVKTNSYHLRVSVYRR
jgi:hypothetical protein